MPRWLGNARRTVWLVSDMLASAPQGTIPAVIITPGGRVRGRLRVPGDKSISHRYALLAALAHGTSTIRNYAPGADCASTLRCLRTLGVDVRTAPDGAEEAGSTVVVAGRGAGALGPAHERLDAGNSGTTMRLLAGILAARPFETTITGDASLQRRPMQRIVGRRGRMGACVRPAGCSPPAPRPPVGPHPPARPAPARRASSAAPRCAARRTSRRWPAPRSRARSCWPGCTPRARRR
ncbi:MAG: hypothetical protein F4Y57_13270 [Acidobacteria bacterium]|nr:hypothetical protein [Acidobacteriota bacterium]